METDAIVEIPVEYKRSGFYHRQFRRGKFSFVYVVTDEQNNIISYEVFKRLVSKAGIAKFGGGPEIEVPAKERKPNDESFGKWAWCIGNINGDAHCQAKALEYFEKLEEFEGNLRMFFEFRSPNPVVKIFELHDQDGKPLSMKIMGKDHNRIVRITADTEDMSILVARAKEAFGNLLNANFDIRPYTPVCIGEEKMHGKSDLDESDDIDNESDDE